MHSLELLIREVDNATEELLEIHRRLVQFPTVNTGIMPTGNELELCQYLHQLFTEEGIPSEVLESAENRGNFIARLGDKGGKAKLMFMSHSDVVPEGDSKNWTFPPFSAKVSEGRVYGRGASDCKGLTACQIMTIILLKRLNVPLKNDLIIAVGADEETGAKYGFGWLAKNVPEKVDAEYAINEGAGSAITTPKGIYFPIAMGEKGRFEAKIRFHGKASHAAWPWVADSVLPKIAEAIEKIHAYQPQRDVSNPTFATLLPAFGIEEHATAENIDGIIERISAQNNFVGNLLRGLSRMTITPTMVSSGLKSNSVPESGELICDIRALPGQKPEYARRELTDILAEIEGCDVDLSTTAISNTSPIDETLLSAMEAATNAALGVKTKILPSLTVGFTDSRLIRALGVTVYNFAPTRPESDPEKNRIHSSDESISIDDLIFRTKVMLGLACHLVAELAESSGKKPRILQKTTHAFGLAANSATGNP